jgi:hydroxymethylpyrimidine/phosphomethylpyrimidine kinase
MGGLGKYQLVLHLVLIILIIFILAELELLADKYISSSPARFKDACKTFEQATRLEVMFWEMGMRLC